MPQSPDSVQSPFSGHSSPKASPRLRATATEPSRGRVFLVGAGPGDPGLITVRGKDCLGQADVVLYDGLVNIQLLELAPQAECICVGKHGQAPIWTQADINRKLVDLACSGQTVVRLKGGDPAVFARTAEELEVLAAAQVAFEVVPGITAALAAASYVGIPITHRQHASAVALVTGQRRSGSEPEEVDWDALARFPGTIVFYMGVTTVAQWTNQLLSHGKDPCTPAAIVRRCSWSDQTVIRCTLTEVIDQLTPSHRLRPPVIVIIGAVAALGSDFDWFTRRPLHGCGVLVTRAEHQSESWVRQLRELGAEVFHQPVIEVLPPADPSSLDQAIELLKLGRVQGITFSSSNGVDGFLQRLWQLQLDMRILAHVRIATVGPSTAEHLIKYGLRADVVPSESVGFNAAGLLQTLGNSVDQENWIVTTTNRSRDELPAGLEQQGANVFKCQCYETRPATELQPAIRSALDSHQIQWVTVTSNAIAEASYRLLSEYRHRLQPMSLSKNISDCLAALNWPAIIQADQNTSHALVNALVDFQFQRKGER